MRIKHKDYGPLEKYNQMMTTLNTKISRQLNNGTILPPTKTLTAGVLDVLSLYLE